MSLFDGIKYAKHVEDNATGVLALKNNLQRSVQRFGLLDLKELDVVIPMLVVLTKPPDQ
jgi:hypothetical protein